MQHDPEVILLHFQAARNDNATITICKSNGLLSPYLFIYFRVEGTDASISIAVFRPLLVSLSWPTKLESEFGKTTRSHSRKTLRILFFLFYGNSLQEIVG